MPELRPLGQHQCQHINLALDKDTYNVRFGIDEETFKRILKDIENSSQIINEELFTYTRELFDHALQRVFQQIKPTDKNYPLYEKFRQNLARVAAYKSYWQTQMLKDSLEGKIEQTPEQINRDFNINYMRHEYVHVVRSARMAQRWQEFEANKHIYPYLEYMPSTAGEPRLEHKKFYGIIKHIDDPFWNTWLPPNGWGCKCSVRPVRSDTGSRPLPENMPPDPPEAMKHNPAKSGVIFSDEISYFKKVKTELPKQKQQKVRETFELLKESIPYELVYESKGKVYAHIFKEEPQKYNENLEVAKLLADNYNFEIKIRPVINIENIKNPDYEINGLITELKYQKGKNVCSNISKALKQKCQQIILYFDENSYIKNSDVLFEKVKDYLIKNRKDITYLKLIAVDKVGQKIYIYEYKNKKRGRT